MKTKQTDVKNGSGAIFEPSCQKIQGILLSYKSYCRMHHQIRKHFAKVLSIGKIFEVSSKIVFSDLKWLFLVCNDIIKI